MSVLSDRDIIDELVRGNILFYPFKKENLQGCVLGLTASDFAYSIEQQVLLKVETDVSSNTNFFEIVPGDTVLVFTNECVALNNYYCATIHSKVKMVSRGLGHIGTKVNPDWSGILSIPIQNLSNRSNRIYVEEVIAYLIFHKLSSRSLYIVAEHKSGRLNDFPGNKYQVSNSDLVIAYLGSLSFGVGMELAFAETNKIPIILLYETGKRISRFPRGIPTVIAEIQFQDHEDALNQLKKVLAKWNPEHP